MKKALLCTVLVVLLSVLLTGCCVSHDWKAATCTEPKTCSKCQETEGTALGHMHGEWQIISEPERYKAGTKAIICNVCHARLQEEYFFYPMFDQTFEEFVEQHNALYKSEKWEIRERKTGFSYYMKNKETALIFHENLNTKENGVATAYSTETLDEFNQLMVRRIIRGKTVDADRLAETLLIGAAITHPLTYSDTSTFIDDFMANQTVSVSTDTDYVSESSVGGYKYILRASLQEDVYSRLFYEFICEVE